jgi:BclB C-terminal domain-containing protein
MTTDGSGNAENVALIGFGTAGEGLAAGGLMEIDDTQNFAFVVPADGTLTSLSASFTETVPLSLDGTTVTVRAQIWVAPEGDLTFTPLSGTDVALTPELTGTVGSNTVMTGTLSGLNVSLIHGTRLMLVFSSGAVGSSLSNTLTGAYSGGINLAIP